MSIFCCIHTDILNEDQIRTNANLFAILSRRVSCEAVNYMRLLQKYLKKFLDLFKAALHDFQNKHTILIRNITLWHLPWILLCSLFGEYFLIVFNREKVNISSKVYVPKVYLKYLIDIINKNTRHLIQLFTL